MTEEIPIVIVCPVCGRNIEEVPILDRKLDSIIWDEDEWPGINTRINACFKNAHRWSSDIPDGYDYGKFYTVRDLLTHTRSELLRIPNFGKKSLHLVEKFLLKHRLGLRKWYVREMMLLKAEAPE